MTAARDELAQIIRKAGWDAQDSPDYEKCGFDSDLFIADAILAAGLPKTNCRVYWGSHGCSLVRGHQGSHVCIDEFPEEAGDVLCSVPTGNAHLFGEDFRPDAPRPTDPPPPTQPPRSTA